jgi:hypothetical protein
MVLILVDELLGWSPTIAVPIVARETKKGSKNVEKSRKVAAWFLQSYKSRKSNQISSVRSYNYGAKCSLLEPIFGEELGTTRHRRVVIAVTKTLLAARGHNTRDKKCS